MADVKRQPIEVADALVELGLTRDIIGKAIMEGEFARNSCTANDPPSAAGYDAWARTVRSFRDQLIPKGWARNDDSNYSTIVNSDHTIAIAVATGDEGTGQAHLVPKTKYARGPAACAAINVNQNVLFPEMRPTVEEIVAAERVTWFLLRRRVGDTVFSELSLPASVTKDGQVNSWETRIIFEPIIDDGGTAVQDDSDDEPIDVPVRRRFIN